MTEAIFGLLGVLIGSLLSLITNLYVEFRRDQIATKVSARLIRDDLYKVAIYLEDAISGRKWIHNDVLSFQIEFWSDQRPQLAKTLNYSAYSTVITSIIVVEQINSWLQNDNSKLDLDSKSIEKLEFWLSDIRNALQELLAIAK